MVPRSRSVFGGRQGVAIKSQWSDKPLLPHHPSPIKSMFKKPSKQDKAKVYNSTHEAANHIYDVIITVLCVKQGKELAQVRHKKIGHLIHSE